VTAAPSLYSRKLPAVTSDVTTPVTVTVIQANKQTNEQTNMQTAYITYAYLSARRGLCTVQRGSVNNADRKCGTTKRVAAAT